MRCLPPAHLFALGSSWTMRRILTSFLVALSLLADAVAPQEPPEDSSTSEAAPQEELESRFRHHLAELRRLGKEGSHEAVLTPLENLRTLAPRVGRPDLVSTFDYYKARAHALLGHREQALESLAAALDGGFHNLTRLRSDPALDTLRGDAALDALLTRLETDLALEWSQEPEKPWVGTFDSLGSPGLDRLRSEHGLEEVVAGAADDHEKLRRLTAWVHDAFDHHGSNAPSSNDPLTILAEGAEGKSFRCLEYGIVLASAATAVGLPGRVLSLATDDVETRESGAGHVAAEVWLPDARRWAFADAQFGRVPELGGEPLTAVELREAILSGAPDLRCPSSEDGSCWSYADFLWPYLYHFYVRADQRRFGDAKVEERDVMLLPVGVSLPSSFQGTEGIYDNARAVHNPMSLYPVPSFRFPPSREGSASWK